MRIGPWRGSTSTAMMSVYVGPALNADAIQVTMDRLIQEGYDHVVTAAVADRDRGPFEQAGFVVKRQLYLLSRTLTDLPAVTNAPPLRTAHRWERSDILELDQAAFDDFWAFDRVGLLDAMSATPVRRIRVTKARPIEGYALAGVGTGVGYLQRLAVSPTATGKGLGGALVMDALAWMRRRSARQAYVNTQVENTRARDLYLRHGFRQLDDGLCILERSLR